MDGIHINKLGTVEELCNTPRRHGAGSMYDVPIKK